MPVDRFFAEDHFHKGEIISLAGDEFHHLSRATRKRQGETIELINGMGDLAKGTLVEINKNAALVTIDDLFREEKKLHDIILIQAIPRMNRLDTIIEKATELGCTAIHLFPGDYSERKDLSESTVQRFKKITQAAIKQSGHLYIPQVIVYNSLKDSLPDESSLFFGDTDPSAPLLFDSLNKSSSSIAIVIGPESGLSAKEESLLKERGAIGVKLIDAILRTDTAPIVALGLISHFILGKTQS